MIATRSLAAADTLESPLAAPVTALLRLLDQLRDVIELLDLDTYASAPSHRRSGSIGAHVRHSLDHVAAFLDAIGRGAMSYDDRARGTAVESRPEAAVARIDALTSALLDLDARALDTPLRLDVQLDPAGASCSVVSTVGRELAYVISHTVHHNATMAVLLSEIGVNVPARFGMAAATPSPAAISCAR
jgi:uncharacterized damage-inducible protein DinB